MNAEQPNNATPASEPSREGFVPSSEWLGDMRANVAAGLREARRHVRSCKANRANLAWAHRKGEIAALRGVARLLKTPMSPTDGTEGRAELAALREDKARLDWLNETITGTGRSRFFKSVFLTVNGSDGIICGVKMGGLHEGKDIRSAIDAARSPSDTA